MSEEFEDKKEIFDSIGFSIKCIMIMWIIILFFFSPSGICQTSMLPTLEDGDSIIMSLMYKPKAGDVVVTTQPNYLNHNLVKRVIAVGGQTVDIDPIEGKVFVDGKELDEPYIKEPTRVVGDFEYPITVPEGKVFAMGDNRNGSLDSRHASIGFIDERYVKGKVFFRIRPLKRFGWVK